MIDHLGLGRMAVLLIAALVVFGPERLPEIAAQLGRGLRQARGVLDSMSAEVKSSVGVDAAGLDLAALHPKALIRDLMAEPTADLALQPEVSSLAAVAQSSSGPPAAFVSEPRLGERDAMALLHSSEDVGGEIPHEWRHHPESVSG